MLNEVETESCQNSDYGPGDYNICLVGEEEKISRVLS